MDVSEIIVRLGAAVLIGGAIGLDRNLHHKPTGVRTLSLVSLGAALAVMAVAEAQADVSRVMQGVVSGIGFIGGGVILHEATAKKVHGLTTAAAIWVTAMVGMLCGLAAWSLVAVAGVLVFLVLFAGGPFERWCHGKWGRDEDEEGG